MLAIPDREHFICLPRGVVSHLAVGLDPGKVRVLGVNRHAKDVAVEVRKLLCPVRESSDFCGADLQVDTPQQTRAW